MGVGRECGGGERVRGWGGNAEVEREYGVEMECGGGQRVWGWGERVRG